MYALDIDMHTAQELAAINNADNVLRYLDAVVAKVGNFFPKLRYILFDLYNRKDKILFHNVFTSVFSQCF